MLPNYCRKKSNIMPTLSLTVLPAKALKDGRNKVRIAVAHNSQTRYIVTDVIIDSPKEWKNGQVVKRGNAAYLNSKLRNKINEVQLAIDNIPYPEILTCAEVIEEVARARAHASCTIGAAFEEMMSVSTSKPSSVAMYRSQFSSISRFIRPGMHVRTISKMTIMTYIKQRSGLSQATIQDHVALLARILRFCQENGYTDFKENPAKGCIRFTTVIRNSWLTPDEVRKVRDAEFLSLIHI